MTVIMRVNLIWFELRRRAPLGERPCRGRERLPHRADGLSTSWTNTSDAKEGVLMQERSITTKKDVAEGKGGACHAKNVTLAQIMTTMAQASAEKGVSVAEEGVRF